MLTTTRLSSLFVLDQQQALDFYVGLLGLEVRADVDLGFMRWLTVGAPGDAGREILLEVPGPPSMDPATAEQVRDLLTKGAAGGWVAFTTADPHAVHARLAAAGADFTDDLEDRGYGVDFGVRDPFGNRLRIGSMRDSAPDWKG
ncbi:MAG: VOC family protein [Frankiales bacterium]|nr:VOC family protein [Frankiales bacterium]